ncbi:MAG: FAD-dependent oxidoreductase [Opitutales bacterium]|nr:FAD-dependent oxidoreductase [Opitutales bacterium]
MHDEQIIIVGSGCAGLSAAIYAARAQLHPLVIEGNQPGGLLTQTTQVENFPGFSEGIQGYELVNRIRKQAEKFGARFLSNQVQRITFEANSSLNPHQLKGAILDDGQTLQAAAIILATGSHPKMLGLPHEAKLLGGKGLSVCATCDGCFYKGETVCVIGGGDSACEEALYLSQICKKVYLVHRRDTLRASKIMADRVQSNPSIECVFDSKPVQYEVDPQGFIQGLQVQSNATQALRVLPCTGIFLAIGWNPNTALCSSLLPLDDKGYFSIDAHLQSSISGLFAAGDCVDTRYRQASVAAGMGVQAALEAQNWLTQHHE